MQVSKAPISRALVKFYKEMSTPDDKDTVDSYFGSCYNPSQLFNVLCHRFVNEKRVVPPVLFLILLPLPAVLRFQAGRETKLLFLDPFCQIEHVFEASNNSVPISFFLR